MVTTNLPFGVTNANRWTNALGTYVANAPTYVNTVFDDFNTLYSGTYTNTATGAGTATIQNAANGVIKILNSAASSDAQYLQFAGGTGATIEPFSFVSGQRTWFEVSFQVSNATNTAFVAGLQITDTTPEAASDGVWFSKAAASTSVSLNVANSSTQTTNTGIATVANATQIVLSFYYNGVNSLIWYVNGVESGSSVITNLPTHTLTTSFGVRNGTAAATSMSLDYIFVSCERNATPQAGT